MPSLGFDCQRLVNKMLTENSIPSDICKNRVKFTKGSISFLVDENLVQAIGPKLY